ncbi:hypothetical protein Pmar_PMAR000649 [Perkinsus marinus ATCC 50983]|uniref:Mei2-like C-terminal RNA recognition motif domain-containing protein n=1 Tax=Perkinsus marinus (strain ATCC 50983 / TXsc) TaxID=423536 RepID=C5KRE3_PERM5|nr:hypothetical protein Pmar_PMAR000649 [Perkinsus marinus ATCC 50983]EER12916.1 hypothetical protein Pmar_PMAR000649 [Perkinsus marinus ATCC 50983]|eukprot:XP_002781121.1 hypothetical protein Pmar_PMAR000649 [Perkinsus marinus ATCC 50983]
MENPVCDAESFQYAHETLKNSGTAGTLDLNANHHTPPHSPALAEGIDLALTRSIDRVATRNPRLESSTKLTVMLRNIPNKLTQIDIANAVKHEGFFGDFDFLYSPIDFKSLIQLPKQTHLGCIGITKVARELL